MTRTERATSPRALLKDRSEARNGYDNSLRKGGAGAHNWGSLDDEGRFEREGQDDEADDFDEANKEGEAGAGKLMLLCGSPVVWDMKLMRCWCRFSGTLRRR